MKNALQPKRRVAVLLIFIALTAHASPPGEFDEMRWVVGTWEMQSAETVTYESWRRISDRIYEGESCGVSRKNGDTVFTEYMLLVEMGGEIFYLPKVEENAFPVPFRMATSQGRKYVFENPGHDFPQRIIYHRVPDDSMQVLVETMDGAQRRQFLFQRRE